MLGSLIGKHQTWERLASLSGSVWKGGQGEDQLSLASVHAEESPRRSAGSVPRLPCSAPRATAL
jgi:hypothetical protein